MVFVVNGRSLNDIQYQRLIVSNQCQYMRQGNSFYLFRYIEISHFTLHVMDWLDKILYIHVVIVINN